VLEKCWRRFRPEELLRKGLEKGFRLRRAAAFPGHPAAYLGLLGFLLSFAATGAFAQYEDLSNLPSSSTAAAAKNLGCTLQGVKLTQSMEADSTLDVSIAFSFSGKPSAFFYNYDAQKKAVVFDFYDTHVGTATAMLDTLAVPPITRTTLDSLQIDLNKDTKGMDPDIRDVARVSMFTPYDLEYEARQTGDVVTMTYKWSGRKEAASERRQQALYWEVPLGVVVLGGVGVGGYELLKSSPSTSCPFCQTPDHPTTP